MTQETMRIGKLASAANVNIQTLRYYERRGLLREPERLQELDPHFPAR